ncbi:MAG: ribosomal protein L7/L12 [Planctomycetes bacterium]|nr:ribosomal protein L7/L12 [Planctomycetota bacterium]
MEAIKLVREVTGCGLAEAKTAVDKLEQEVVRPGQQPALGGKEAEDEIRRLLREDRKIEAIKVYREATGCGLKEAKDAVERIAAES